MSLEEVVLAKLLNEIRELGGDVLEFAREEEPVQRITLEDIVVDDLFVTDNDLWTLTFDVTAQPYLLPNFLYFYNNVLGLWYKTIVMVGGRLNLYGRAPPPVEFRGPILASILSKLQLFEPNMLREIAAYPSESFEVLSAIKEFRYYLEELLGEDKYVSSYYPREFSYSLITETGSLEMFADMNNKQMVIEVLP